MAPRRRATVCLLPSTVLTLIIFPQLRAAEETLSSGVSPFLMLVLNLSGCLKVLYFSVRLVALVFLIACQSALLFICGL